MKTRQTLSHQFSRRQFAGAALVGAAALLLPAATQAAEVTAPVDAAPVPLALSPSSGESGLLIQAVPLNVGYALTPAQTKEVAAQLQNYSSGFAKVRAYAIPEDAEPAFAATAPMRKGRAR